MLRHIVSLGLVMTACAALIPTKVNAVTLTITPNPNGEIQKSPGELIDFSLVLDPAPFSPIKVLGSVLLGLDGGELISVEPGIVTAPNGTLISSTTTIATYKYKVLTPVKDGISDIQATVFYEESSPSDIIRFVSGTGPDVVPVPEPLTMFGTALGLGCGVLFKRKSSKKIVS
jgi:hypothetical protein